MTVGWHLNPVLLLAAFMAAAISIASTSPAFAQQDVAPPTLRAGALPDTLSIDGRLDEEAWKLAESVDTFAQTDPVEGAPPSGRTTVRVLAGPRALAIGVNCEDPDPAGIVSFSVRRDAALTQEDHVRVVLGPFLDGRSGYVFAINPSGARYDGLVNPGGESDNPDWDGIWESATARLPSGWSVELRIPIQTLTFKPGLREWHFNVQRRIQRRLETDRWAFPARQYQVTQTSRLSERQMGHCPDAQADRPRLRSVGGVRPSACGPSHSFPGEQPNASRPRAAAAAVSRVHAVCGDRSVGTMVLAVRLP